ncbi:hydroxylamine oxidation protein HaoB [Methylocystis sp. 9N]|uniref:Hydroxylamine oxidation protein HaoB n=1 Tax=Methylocystis borbori TaxID=3118750 RepID=A0ABU7XJ10_9HYPH
MRRIVGAALLLIGAALLAWSVWPKPRPARPYEAHLAPAPADALQDAAGFGVTPENLLEMEVRAPERLRPVATGLVARDDAGLLTPLVWRNEVTEPIFFADVSAVDAQKVLAAIREHIPQDAVTLAWWDLSRAIQLVAGRAAPLDDAKARGLLLPAGWDRAWEHARWGAGADKASSETFDRFIDALLLTDEKQAAEKLKELAGGKPAYVAVHISDVWKAAAARPERLAVAYKDFASAGVSHGLIKSAQQWLREERIEGGYAVEPMGGATRLHYFPRKSDGDTLIARLLPFSTSNPARLDGLQLVYQHKGWWIYKLAD